jgi:hypothetical protein
MGRRSRKRTSPGSPSAPVADRSSDSAAPERERRAPAAARPPRAAPPARPPSRRDAAPQAPWGGFPLAELCVLAAIVLGVAGFVVGGSSGNVLLVGAVVLGSLAGLEVAIREHLGGYRSHTLVLAGALAAATLGVSIVAKIDRTVILPIAAGVFAAGCLGFRALFKRRSGGFGMRVR